MYFFNKKLHGNLPNQTRLDNADRQTGEDTANWRLCDYTRAHKNLL
jgi:hypothetical protein